MTKVAIIIPTMNRPDFILRQFEFYELMNSPHPIYLSDSSGEENAKKIKEGIGQFKKLNITYQWSPPGPDHLHSLLPLVGEKYCIQMGDDDLVIPQTILDCADFLENHPDYATCAGKQVNIRLRAEDRDQPWGTIERQTKPLGRSLEREDRFERIRNFWSDPSFICFTVTRTEIQKKIREITKHFFLADYATEFVVWSALIIYGKAKVLEKLGYIMQISNLRSNFVDYPGIEWMMSSSNLKEKWGIILGGLAEIFQELDYSPEENFKMARWTFMLYLIRQFALEVNNPMIFSFLEQKRPLSVKQNLSKKIKYFISDLPLFKEVYYKFKNPEDVARPESKYFKDFKIIKNFLESRTK